MLWELRGKASAPPKRVLMPGAKPSRVLTKITWWGGGLMSLMKDGVKQEKENVFKCFSCGRTFGSSP